MTAIGVAPVPFATIAGALRAHLAALPGPVDSFFEDHLVAAQPYRIIIDGAEAGFAAIHGDTLIVQFALDPAYRRYGQAAFARLRRQEQVSAALVPTVDEFFLAHALDDYRQLAKQAYFFVAAPDAASGAAERAQGYHLRPATADDMPLIEREAGEFFAPIDRYLAARALFVTTRDNAPVGFGLAARSTLYPATASIGMFVSERERRAGVGTATIALLIAECARQGVRPIAGCWYYNHRSKATLERAGMYAPTRLLRVEY